MNMGPVDWAKMMLGQTTPHHKLNHDPRLMFKEGNPLPQREGYRVVLKSKKIPGPVALRSPEKRAELLHVFLHHEIQAAELMAWVILRFNDEAPVAFMRGLHQIALEEIKHAQLYQDRLQALGYSYGEFSVRDWFWEKMGKMNSLVEFIATMHIGVEGGNLDHTERFMELFKQAGDEASVQVLEQIHQDEITHVKFGKIWFEKLHAPFEFEAWKAQLVSPLSPWLMRHLPIAREARIKAGLDDVFCLQLSEYEPT